MKYITDIPFSATKTDLPCIICPMARQSKPAFPISTITTKQCFDLIYIDTWGLYKTPTYRGKRYFFTIGAPELTFYPLSPMHSLF